ncbi:MAG: hypothetical protein J7L39_01710 [Candidatus Aenigmarchaeota archaeon]|nr:hypothetical protein [Candidatus Aenigmarchaeota archaeon]
MKFSKHLIAFSLFLLIINISFGSRYETDKVIVNVSLLPSEIIVEISDKLAEGIFFTNETGKEINVQYPVLPGSEMNSAVWNYNQSDENKKSSYWVRVLGGAKLDICHEALYNLCTNANCTGANNLEIDISNVLWSSSFFSDENNPSENQTSKLYLTTEKIARNLGPGTYLYLRYWLNVPPGTSGGNYTTLYRIQAVLSGETCG